MKFSRITGVLFIFMLISLASYAQPNNINLNAQIKDSLGETVPAATVMLLNSRDSTLVNYTTSNSDGFFSFKNIKNTGYILKVSHISFMPIQINIPISNDVNVNMGIITVVPIAEVLMEVVIKSAQAPLFIRGDTVEYDARLFKVPPGSTVEDLLRRLPGIDVDASGNISTMGKDVRRVYVDGKTFFGDDPTTVTKNLDANAISKVQVYNDKSEQERLTGIKTGNEDKVMNLELKEEYKKGYFGKASAAAGTEKRWMGRGSFNRFNEKTQISFIGYGNNVNASGVNWDDYAEFKGNSAYSDYDNGDFGFESNQGHRHYSMSMVGNHFDGRGFTENYGGGTNFNYFDKKTKFNAGYFYNQTDLHYDQFRLRQTFLADTSFLRLDTTDYNQLNFAHTINTRIEMEIDSNNTAIVRFNARLSGNDKNSDQFQIYRSPLPAGIDINSNLLSETSEFDSYSVNALGLYSHKFKKKGRTFAASAAIDLNENNNERLTDNINTYFLSLTPSEQLKLLNESNTSGNVVKSSLMYVEPLGKRISIMNFYNFSNVDRISTSKATDALNQYSIIDSLSNHYRHEEIYNRIGASINYAHEGLNVSLGGAYQAIGLNGKFAVSPSDMDVSVLQPKNYYNFIPNLSASLELANNLRFNLGYYYNINAPSISQLQPINNITNPLYRTVGNPELTPEKSHDISASTYYWNRASFMSFSLSGGYSMKDNTITYNQFTEFVDDVGYVTFSKPENVNGGNSAYAYSWASFPIIKTVLTVNFSGSARTSNTPVFINGVENITNSFYYRTGLGLNLTLGQKLSFNFGAAGSNNDVTYSLQTNQNQTITSYSASSGIKWQFLKKTYLEGNMDWTNYKSTRLDYDTDLMIVNLSIRQILGEKNRFELRLSAIDLLNQKQYLIQAARENYSEYTSSPTLARYFMLGVSYNLKGFESNVKGNRWF